MTKRKTGAGSSRTGQQSKEQAAAPYSETGPPRLAVEFDPKDAITAIERATAAHPILSRDGMGLNLFDPYARHFSICGVVTALTYLSQFPKQAPQYSSDWLKDKATEWGTENALDCAVGNGDLIVAAVFLGLPVKHDDGPNVRIGINLRWVRATALH